MTKELTNAIKKASKYYGDYKIQCSIIEKEVEKLLPYEDYGLYVEYDADGSFAIFTEYEDLQMVIPVSVFFKYAPKEGKYEIDNLVVLNHG